MKTLKKALQFEKEYHHAKKTKYLRALDPYLKYLPILLSSREGLHSKQLMIGLTAAMQGIIKGKHTLGLFSEDFEKMCRLVAKGLVKCTPGAGEMETRLLTQLIMGSLTALTGLLGLAYDQNPPKEEQSKKGDLLIELLVRAAFASDVPITTLQAISEACGLEGQMAPKSLETLALLYVLLAFSKEGGDYDTELLEGIKERLMKNFDYLETTLSDLVLAETLSREAAQPIRLFIGQGKQTLASRNFNQFLKGLHEMVKPYGLSLTLLQGDIKTSRRLFSVLHTHFNPSTQPQGNLMTFIG